LRERWVSSFQVEPRTSTRVDINIVAREDTWPHPQQTGLEFLELLAALAGNVSVQSMSDTTFAFNADKDVVFMTPTTGSEFSLNGQGWPCVSSAGVLLPSGSSVLEIKPVANSSDTLRITDVSAPIDACAYTNEGIQLKYRGRQNALVTLNHRVAAIRVDGRAQTLPSFDDCEAQTVYLPAGAHEVVFVAAPR
jgi:hypothetical protein